MSNKPEEGLLENIRSKEEEEELQEQQRRQEELDCLLSDGIQAFNSGDNSPNSTHASLEAADSEYRTDSYSRDTQNYIETTPNDQLKVLYDVRVREIHELSDEFKRFRSEKNEELNGLVRKLTVSEGEIRQLQISLTNIESLLVEKTGIINDLKENLRSKEVLILKLQQQVEDDQIEISTCKTTITELKFKLANNNPFNSFSQNFKSSELQKAHQERILKLEALLEEEAEKNNNLERENSHLQEKLKKVIQSKSECDEDNNLTIVGLSQRLQTAQQQSKDLFILGEALKTENDHFKERLKQVENDVPIVQMDYLKGKDNETILRHFENLTKLLLDKDIELNTLKNKLKSYDSHMKEFFEYKNLTSKLEIKNCSNKDHVNQLLFLQKGLSNCHMQLEDRDQKIFDFEQKLQQNRNDLVNLSQKYNVPQLKAMSEDLKNAEEKILGLTKLLETNELEKRNLVKQIEELKITEKEVLKQLSLFEEIETENYNLKNKLNDISISNDKLLKDNNKKNSLQKEIEELLYSKIRTEREKEELESQLKDSLSDLECCKKETQSLKTELETVSLGLKEEIVRLENELQKFRNKTNLKEENNYSNMKNLQQELNNCIHEENVVNSNLFKNCLQTEILKVELKLQEQFQSGNLENLETIEEKYRKVCAQKNDEISQLKAQEATYRKQLAFILAQCSETVTHLENDNEKLKLQNNTMIEEFKNFKKNVQIIEEKYQENIKNIASHLEEKHLKWKENMKKLLKNISESQRTNANKVNTLLQNSQKFDKQRKKSVPQHKNMRKR